MYCYKLSDSIIELSEGQNFEKIQRTGHCHSWNCLNFCVWAKKKSTGHFFTQHPIPRHAEWAIVGRSSLAQASRQPPFVTVWQTPFKGDQALPCPESQFFLLIRVELVIDFIVISITETQIGMNNQDLKFRVRKADIWEFRRIELFSILS